MKPRPSARGITTVNALLDLPTLISVATRLVNREALSEAEEAIANLHSTAVSDELVEVVRAAIVDGTDPLGAAYCVIRSPQQRRSTGQTFTPVEAVLGMFTWAEAQGEIARIVDPGAGTGRYVLHGLRQNPRAIGIASEMDPLVALLLRANATALGLAERLAIFIGDYRTLELEPITGRTLFIGNPPYVRHHDILPSWKEWYSDSLKALGHAASKLAGLHLHFFVKTLDLARPGDLGCFITAAEWLDVNYGQSMRDMLTNGLGGRAIFVVAPEVPVFGDAMVSACITCFEPGTTEENIEFRTIDNLEQLLDLTGGHFADKKAAQAQRTWSILLRNQDVVRNEAFVDLGELFKVSRGQVTGKNSVWVAKDNRFGIPAEYLIPAITDAADIIHSGGRIADVHALRRVIALPAVLDDLPREEYLAVQEFLRWARSQDADKGWIAQHRSPWWRVNMSKPAPQIVVTYMGRRPPVFAVNAAGAGIINVAHGLYAKVALPEQSVEKLVTWLNSNVSQDLGRVYAGGLTKFEPSEVARLRIPSVDLLREGFE
ncbi:Eco57I restriction-modification methylase domain-containing protein [Pseudoduganella chitinolytica]|uniref:site-specific DNA-methyltransferase (adenine-specific) n=1 Tax=Pseudoduganella chitinolytica TaxID=34070 RepID=A0ABY8BA71_9BURK|nr:class I SAM-dependent methyltransferase [Pseudoduganella chitinolytica]WEF32817.1 class I SAM-dependent methyltransferase [Pseudoduganella chitinolytica]